MKPTARKAAFDLLCRQERLGSYSNLALDESLRELRLDAKEAALTTQLFYGVLERRITLDYALSRHLRQPLKKLKPQVLTILRLGAYQILFLTKIPQSAVVNEAVKLAKSSGCGFAGGLVNGVLRSLAREPLTYDKLEDPCKRSSVQYACPEWLVRMWQSAYGEDNAVGILKSAFGRPPLHIRVNTVKTSDDALIKRLTEEGAVVQKAAPPHALTLEHTGAVEKLPSFQDGLFHVQDLSSQYCAMALGVHPGDRVLDLCAAPGGKSFTLAQWMENEGELSAFDLYPQRAALVAEGAKRLGLSCIQAKTGNAEEYDEKIGKFDKILCDVPCSGLGILRRKPEIRFKSPLDIDNLPDLQYRILCTASNYCTPGGRLVYSTCTLHPKENEGVVSRFLEEHLEFREETVLPELIRPQKGPGISLMPHIHGTDGFYFAVLIRTR